MNAPRLTLPPRAEPLRFRADVARLEGTLFLPAGAPRAAIVLHGATAVPARYYRPFAEWLAGEGYACLTYDYRDFGASARVPARAARASLADWGLRDQPAAQRALEARLPGVPVWVVGHSLGGFMVPFHEGAGRIARLITVASGPVHFSDHPPLTRALVAAFWWGPLAGLARVLGYLPGRRLGLGADLPLGVFHQWRRWCTTKGFYLGEVGRSLPMPDWSAFRGRMRAVAVADDVMVPPAAVWRLMQHYPEAWKSQAVLPADRGPVGHVGVFAARNAHLWPGLIGPDTAADTGAFRR